LDNKEHTAQYIFNFVRKSLYALYDRHETDSITQIIFEHTAQLSKLDLLARENLILGEDIRDIIYKNLKLLLAGMPVQYVTGIANFYGLTLKVSPSVLIPRQETEELVDWIIKENKLEIPKILDLCTGSGCIALALKSEIKNAEITAVDVCEKALEIATQNSINTNLKIQFLLKNLLIETFDKNFQYNIIVSNPPYVKNSEKELMHKNVFEYEPHLALFVEDNDPLLFYKKIISIADNNLVSNGCLYFEINEALYDEINILLLNGGYKQILLKKDLNGKPRMIRALKP
jgi:release factor glutamine methyltransferase